MKIVAERRANPRDLVGGDLFTLSAAAEYDAPPGPPIGHRSGHREADRRVVDRLFAVRTVVLEGMSKPPQRRLEVLFEQKASVICADGDAHGQ